MTRGGVILRLSWCSSYCMSWSQPLALCWYAHQLAGDDTLRLDARAGGAGLIVALVSCSKPAWLLALNFRSSAVGGVLVAAIVLFSWLLSLQFFMLHLLPQAFTRSALIATAI